MSRNVTNWLRHSGASALCKRVSAGAACSAPLKAAPARKSMPATPAKAFIHAGKRGQSSDPVKKALRLVILLFLLLLFNNNVNYDILHLWYMWFLIVSLIYLISYYTTYISYFGFLQLISLISFLPYYTFYITCITYTYYDISLQLSWIYFFFILALQTKFLVSAAAIFS